MSSIRSRRSRIFYLFGFALLLFCFGAAGCGGGDSKEAPPSNGSTPKFSLSLPKGILAPAPGSDLILTARAIVDPGTPGARTVDLIVDLSANRVSGVIEGVPAGSHTVEIQYFLNQVQVATITLTADVVPGQDNPVTVAPASIHYVETVSDALFVAKSDDLSIAIFDHYSTLAGGRVAAAPTRLLKGPNTGIAGPSAGSLFVDPLKGGLYLADTQADSVRIWSRAATANGNIPPDRVLAGSETQLFQPNGIAVDSFRGRLYVVIRTGEILIWNEADTLTGNIPPAAVINGGLDVANHPLYLDVKNDLLYVADGTRVLVFEKLSRLTGNQDVAPVRTIRIADLSQAGLAVDPVRDLLFVSSQEADGKIHRVAGASSASGDVAPEVTLAGAETGLNQTTALALSGNVLMALNQGGSEVRVWHQANQIKADASPTQILAWSSPAAPVALFYAGTQNGDRDQAQQTLEIQKSGNGHGTVTSDLPGINCGTTCSALFGVGEMVTLTAAAEGGSIFSGWGGACSGTDLCVVTMDAAKTVTATFNDTQGPTAPTGLTTTATGASQINLTWTASTDNGEVAGYLVERCQGSGCSNFAQIATTTVTTYNDIGLLPSTSYRYRVRATDTAGNLGGYSSVAGATTAANPVLKVIKSGTGAGTVTTSPAGINCGATCSASFVSGTSITLTASAETGSTVASFSGECAGTAVTCKFNITTDATVTVTINDTQPPTVPTGLTATALSSGTQINLVWTASTDNIGVTGYQIQRCPGTTSCTTSFTQIGTSTSASFNDTGVTNGTAYRYRVRAVDAAGRLSSFSNIATATTPDTAVPSAPTDLRATPSSSTQINLSWTASTDNVGVSGYWIERCQGVGCNSFSRVNSSLVVTTSFNDTRLSENTSYSYRVQAADGAGNLSAYSAVVGATTLDSTPPVISSVNAGNITGTGATIAWTTNEAADSQVEYGTTTAYGSSTLVNTSLVTNHSVPLAGLLSQTVYHYRVKSKDAAGNPATSADFTFTTLDTTAPNISNVASSNITSSGATISWTTDEASDSQVEYGTTTAYGSSTSLNTTLVTNHSVALSGLLPQTLYHYQVKSRDASGNLAVSSDFTFTTAAPPDTTPPTISNVVSGNITATSVTITWTTDEASDSQVEYGTTTSYGSNSLLDTSNVTSHSVTLSNLSGSTLYHYRIKSRDSAGNLATSGDFTFTTTDITSPTVPSNLTATMVNGTLPDLSWTVSTDNIGVSGYWIERCQGAGCGDFTRINNSLVTAANYSDTSLTPGASYRYRVQAADAAGNLSAYSNIAEVFTLKVIINPALGAEGHVTGPGIDCGTGLNQSDCSEVYTSGTQITLTAEQVGLSTFSGWSGDCTGTTATCDLLMNSDKSVQADFTLLGIGP